MKKLGIVILSLGLAGILGLVTAASPQEALAAAPCKRSKFETTLISDACKKGGQAQAKKVMKAWLKEAKKKQPSLGCATCHSKVAGAYPLKPDGLKTFKSLGGL